MGGGGEGSKEDRERKKQQMEERRAGILAQVLSPNARERCKFQP